MVRSEWRAAFGFSASIVFTFLSGRADRPSSRSPKAATPVRWVISDPHALPAVA